MINWKKWKERAKLVLREGYVVGQGLLFYTGVGACIGYFPTLFFGPVVFPLTYIGAGIGFIIGSLDVVGYIIYTANWGQAWRWAGKEHPAEKYYREYEEGLDKDDDLDP